MLLYKYGYQQRRKAMRQESVEHIEQLLQDKNLIQVQVHLNHEDNEFSCDVFCEAEITSQGEEDYPLEQGRYGYTADCIPLNRVPRSIIARLQLAKQCLEVVAQAKEMKRK
jgi:hypothetical protein